MLPSGSATAMVMLALWTSRPTNRTLLIGPAFRCGSAPLFFTARQRNPRLFGSAGPIILSRNNNANSERRPHLPRTGDDRYPWGEPSRAKRSTIIGSRIRRAHLRPDAKRIAAAQSAV